MPLCPKNSNTCSVSAWFSGGPIPKGRSDNVHWLLIQYILEHYKLEKKSDFPSDYSDFFTDEIEEQLNLHSTSLQSSTTDETLRCLVLASIKSRNPESKIRNPESGSRGILKIQQLDCTRIVWKQYQLKYYIFFDS